MANKDLAYLLREVVLIVAGILIAFALNAWWQGRSAVATETAYLTRLDTDLGTTDAALEKAIARITAMSTTTANLMRLTCLS